MLSKLSGSKAHRLKKDVYIAMCFNLAINHYLVCNCNGSFPQKRQNCEFSPFHISATSASSSSLLMSSSFVCIFCLGNMFSFLNVKICTFKFHTCLSKAAFLFNFDPTLERPSQILSMAGLHSLKCLIMLCSGTLFSSLRWLIKSWASFVVFIFPSSGHAGDVR